MILSAPTHHMEHTLASWTKATSLSGSAPHSRLQLPSCDALSSGPPGCQAIKGGINIFGGVTTSLETSSTVYWALKTTDSC